METPTATGTQAAGPDHPSALDADLYQARLDPRLFHRPGLHGAAWVDDFVDGAALLREELLRFPRWVEMTTNTGIIFERQCGISTGPIGDIHPPELPASGRFRRFLVARTSVLAELVGARPIAHPLLYMNGMAYGHGSWLLRHTDEAPKDRERLSFILYLTPPEDGEWGEGDGGTLRLSDDAGAAIAIRPRFNRFVVFRNSDTSFHEVDLVRRQTSWPTCRLALSGWIYS